MNHLFFATGNEAKFLEAKAQLEADAPGTTLDRLDIQIPEIQSDDPEEILRQKVQYVSSKTTKPFIVDDASFDTDRYPGFPGSYAKFVNSTLGREGLQRLFDEGDSIRAVARVALCYLGRVQQFEGELEGTLQFDGVKADSGLLLNSLIHVDGVPLGEALQDPEFKNHRRKAIAGMAQWLTQKEAQTNAQKEVIGERWTSRSAGWKGMIEDAESYVNFEDNYARVNAMIRKVAPMASGRALEIGCGTGEAGRILKESNPELQVLSTDISTGMLAEARSQTKEAGLDIDYRQADITKDDLGDDYGILISRGVVLSHLPHGNIYDFLESATKLTKPEGYFLFDFMQSVSVGDVEKPVDSKNEFSLGQLNEVMGELGWKLVEDDGEDMMRVRVACYQKVAEGSQNA